jgi:hypothetical protein
VKASFVGAGDALSEHIGRLRGSDLGSNPTLVSQLTDLASEVHISDGDKKALLSGLQQRSTLGQRRYAEKLYAEVNEAVKAPRST